MIDQVASGRDFSDGERLLAHALERQRESLHVRDLASHQQLQCVLCAGVVAEIDQTLVNNLGARFGSDVAAQVHIQLAVILR